MLGDAPLTNRSRARAFGARAFRARVNAGKEGCPANSRRPSRTSARPRGPGSLVATHNPVPAERGGRDCCALGFAQRRARTAAGARAGRRISGLHPISFHLGVAEISVFEVLRPGKAASVRANVGPLHRSPGALGGKGKGKAMG